MIGRSLDEFGDIGTRDGKGLLFVGGLHRSGTTVLARLIASHPHVSALSHTGVPEDEGQHLQSVVPTAAALGGPGRFGLVAGAHLTERSPLVNSATRNHLIRAWAPYWDSGKPYLLEKSPPNMLRCRFLQEMFPAAWFIVIVRHPIVVSCATMRWTGLDMAGLMTHWFQCHQILREDAEFIRRFVVVRYEALVASPGSVLRPLFGLLRIGPHPKEVEVQCGINRSYMRLWRENGRGVECAELQASLAEFGYSIDDVDTVRPTFRGEVLPGSGDSVGLGGR